MSKKVTSNQKPSTVKSIDGSDGRVKINLYIPGYAPLETTINIRNIVGNTNIVTRNPSLVVDAIMDGLRERFGGV